MTTTTQSPLPVTRAPQVPEIPETLRAAFGSLVGANNHLPLQAPALTAFRMAAWNAFAAQGLPGTKHEDFSFVSAADLKAALMRAPEETSAPRIEGEGFETASLSDANTDEAAHESDVPAALAMAFASHPLFIRVSKKAPAAFRLRLPAGKGRTDHAVFVRVDEGADAEIALDVDGLAGDGFSNAAVIVSAGANARLRVLLHDAPEGIQMMKLRFDIEKDARVELLSVTTGSRLARLAVEADLLGPGAAIDLRGATALAGTNRAHRHLKIRHAAPDCTSKQVFKAVVSGAGRSSVDGTVIVDRGAQRTDARQLLQHLLLSPEGRADAKPRLLIHADDVKCSHGATVGKTDPAQKFYLLSRGLTADEADRLLTQAFLDEALELFPADATGPARKRLMNAVTGGAA